MYIKNNLGKAYRIERKEFSLSFGEFQHLKADSDRVGKED